MLYFCRPQFDHQLDSDFINAMASGDAGHTSGDFEGISPLEYDSSLRRLNELKQRVESVIVTLSKTTICTLSRLTPHNISLEIDEPLGDAKTNPRAFMNAFIAQKARSQVRLVQDIRRSLMSEIDTRLALLLDRQRDRNESESGSAMPPAAFLQVTSVSEGSPAAEAGLRAGDQLTALGSVRADNFGSLADVAGAVAVTALRGGRRLSLQLPPRAWAGQGLLGCTLVPIDQPER